LQRTTCEKGADLLDDAPGRRKFAEILWWMVSGDGSAKWSPSMG
jgi:hypothetical protein